MEIYRPTNGGSGEKLDPKKLAELLTNAFDLEPA
jgi:hypothetical protein